MGHTELIPPAAGNRHVWLRMGTLLDGVSTQPIRNAHIVYDREQILFVSADKSPSADLVNPGQNKPDADLPDYTLLPGLIEAHAHFFLEGGELNADKRAAYLKQSPDELLSAAQPRLEKLLHFGVIAVRDAGDKDGVGLALSKLYRSRRREKADGRPLTRPLATLSPSDEERDRVRGDLENSLMPYLDSPGAAIHHKGRYGSFMGEPIETFASASDCVKARIEAGADRIKLIATGIINFQKGAVTTEPQMTSEEVGEFVRAARSFGRQTFAHASGASGIENIIEGGVDSVEHGFFIRDDQLARMRDRQIAWVPTFAPVQKQVDHAALMGWNDGVISNLNRILDQHAASLVKAHAMGVQIIAGSDAGSYGVPHGLGFLYELELMERAGLSSLAVASAATGVSSSRLGFAERFGQIKPGYRSRFILTRHSPLAGVTNLRKDKYVVFDGVAQAVTEDSDPTGL